MRRSGASLPEKWLPLLKRIRDGGKWYQLYVSPQGMRTIVRKLGMMCGTTYRAACKLAPA